MRKSNAESQKRSAKSSSFKEDDRAFTYSPPHCPRWRRSECRTCCTLRQSSPTPPAAQRLYRGVLLSELGMRHLASRHRHCNNALRDFKKTRYHKHSVATRYIVTRQTLTLFELQSLSGCHQALDKIKHNINIYI